MFSQILFAVVLTNTYNVSNYLKFKDKLPDCARSNVIYRVSCTSCNASYVGSMQQKLKTHIFRHRTLSEKPSLQLLSPLISELHSHAQHRTPQSRPTLIHAHCINLIDQIYTEILETMHVRLTNPSLKIHSQAMPPNVI